MDELIFRAHLILHLRDDILQKLNGRHGTEKDVAADEKPVAHIFADVGSSVGTRPTSFFLYRSLIERHLILVGKVQRSWIIFRGPVHYFFNRRDLSFRRISPFGISFRRQTFFSIFHLSPFFVVIVTLAACKNVLVLPRAPFFYSHKM